MNDVEEQKILMVQLVWSDLINISERERERGYQSLVSDMNFLKPKITAELQQTTPSILNPSIQTRTNRAGFDEECNRQQKALKKPSKWKFI